MQSVGGTGALRIGLDFLKKNLGMDTVYVSTPTWGKFKPVFSFKSYTT